MVTLFVFYFYKILKGERHKELGELLMTAFSLSVPLVFLNSNRPDAIMLALLVTLALMAVPDGVYGLKLRWISGSRPL